MGGGGAGTVAGVGVSVSWHRVVEGMYALPCRQPVQGGRAVATWTGQFKRGSTVIGDGTSVNDA